MTTTPDHHEPSPQGPRVSPRWRVLHVVALCAFAFTEPLLSALARQTVYLHDEQFGAVEFGAVLLVLTLVIPATCVLLDRIAQHLAIRVAGRGRNTVLFVLSVLVALSLLRPTARWAILEENYLAWLFALAVAIPGAWCLIRWYERSESLRGWLTVSAIGVVAFPLSFAWTIQHAEHQRVVSETRNHIERPIPVIMVVFDEFSGTSLMDERLEVDAVRLPNFARLAAGSTWYRQASTVHARTECAVPAILSGRFPSTPRRPTLADHPGNLLEIVHDSGTYDMSVFEPVTRLCPESLGHAAPRTPRPLVQRVVRQLQTLATVYPRLVLPNDMPIEFPEIPKPWFGMAERPLATTRPLKTGLFHYDYSQQRDVQLDHFLDCLNTSPRPPFRFLHVVLPHYPWTYYPSGRSYIEASDAAWKPDGGWGELGENWPADEALVRRSEYRYLMQVTATDRFLGRLLDRLQEIDLLDRCLLVVMADHGVSFRPTRSRRLPDADNVTDLMSVPLFIKRPGQTVGRIDDRNVETIDVFPTVAEELGITLLEPVDGLPLSQTERRPRKTFYFDNGMTVLEPRLPHLEAAVRRRLDAFTEASLDRPPRAATSRPEWIGRPLGDFHVEDSSLSDDTAVTLTRNPDAPSEAGPSDRLLSRLLAGELASRVVTGDSTEVLLAVGGVVYDSSRTFLSTSRRTGFSFVLPESAGAKESAEIELFVVKPATENAPTLVRLRRWTIGPKD